MRRIAMVCIAALFAAGVTLAQGVKSVSLTVPVNFAVSADSLRVVAGSTTMESIETRYTTSAATAWEDASTYLVIGANWTDTLKVGFGVHHRLIPSGTTVDSVYSADGIPNIGDTVRISAATTGANADTVIKLSHPTYPVFDLISGIDGAYVYGPGIYPGTTVTYTDSMHLALSRAATLSAAGASKFYFSTADSSSYASGDCMGAPFAVEVKEPNGYAIADVVLIDDETNAKDFDIVFFRAPWTYGADNAAFAPTDVDAENFLGTISVSSHTTYTYNSISQWSAGRALAPAGSSTIYGQLVAKGTQVFETHTPLTLKLVFTW